MADTETPAHEDENARIAAELAEADPKWIGNPRNIVTRKKEVPAPAAAAGEEVIEPAVPAAVEPVEPVTPVAGEEEEPVVAKGRKRTGRATGETWGGDEPVPESEAEVEAQVEAERLLAGKFKSADELEAGYKALESKLGERAGESDRLKRLEEEIENLRKGEGTQQLEGPGLGIEDEDDLENFLAGAESDQDFQQKALQALQYQPEVYGYIIDAWAEASPFKAAQFDAQVAIQSSNQELIQTLAEQYAPIISDRMTQQFNMAWATVAEARADIMDYKDEMVSEMTPADKEALKTGTIEQQTQMLDRLYRIAKSNHLDELIAGGAAATQAEREAARVTTAKATVARATSTQPVKTVRKSATEAFDERIRGTGDPYDIAAQLAQKD